MCSLHLAAMDQRASPDVVLALEQMGFEHISCVAAAVACNNDVQASTEWLLAAPPASPAASARDQSAGQRRTDGVLPRSPIARLLACFRGVHVQ